jgi:hypothetical protein
MPPPLAPSHAQPRSDGDLSLASMDRGWTDVGPPGQAPRPGPPALPRAILRGRGYLWKQVAVPEVDAALNREVPGSAVPEGEAAARGTAGTVRAAALRVHVAHVPVQLKVVVRLILRLAPGGLGKQHEGNQYRNSKSRHESKVTGDMHGVFSCQPRSGENRQSLHTSGRLRENRIPGSVYLIYNLGQG